MNNLKKIIVWIILIILIIIIILFTLIRLEKKDEKQEEVVVKSIKQETIIDKPITDNTVELEIGKFEYIEICKCLNSYISEIYLDKPTYYSRDDAGNYIKIVSDEEINKNIYGVLSQDYIQKNSITIDNVRNYVHKIENNSFYVPIEIHKKVENDFMSTYVIYGIIGEISNNPIAESYLILNIDEANRTYSVEPLNNIQDIQNVEVPILEKVENQGNNTLGGGNTTSIDESIITMYLSVYKKVAITYPEIAYDYLLDDEYKQKRFGSVDNYKQYIIENRNNIVGINIKQYEAIVRDGYTQYVGVDQNGKYYFFNATSANEYKAILDYYTVDIPQFVEQYEVAQETEKIGYNINKCIDSINNFDYTYMYSKLDENFKNNNFQNEESFREFLKNNLFEKNEAINISCTQEGEVYVCDVNIANADDRSQVKKVTFITKLGSGTDFVMSFSIE